MSTDVASRVRELRKALGLTTRQVALRGDFSQGNGVFITKIESGDNKLSTVEAREKLARGFGLTTEQLVEYIEGRAALEATIKHARAGQATRSEPPPHPADDAQDPLEYALLWSIDRERHTMRDLDAIRSAFQNSAKQSPPGFNLIAAARVWLDAAERLRKRHVAVTLESLLLETTFALQTPVDTKE